MIVDKINEYLFNNDLVLDDALRYEVEKIAGFSFKKQFMNSEQKDNKGKIWFSSVGKCARQLAYQFHGFEKNGKKIDGRAKLIFWTGDLVEFTIIGLAKLAGVNLIATGLHQLHISLPLNGNEGEISGRPDGLVIQPKEIMLLEVKSFSSFSFKRFEEGEIDTSYLAQVNVGLEALGLNRCVFVGYNKDNGIMHEIILERNDNIIQKARENVLQVIHSTPEELPDPPKELDFDEKTRLYPWNCCYCAYHGHCRTNAERVLVRNSYKLKEKQ